MSPKALRIAIVLVATVLVAGIVWAARSIGPSHAPSSAHLQAPGSLTTPTTGATDTVGGVQTGDADSDGIDSAPRQEEEPLTGADPVAPAESPPATERRFGIVVSILGGSPYVLVLDLAQLLPKDEGAPAASADLMLYNKTVDLVHFPVAEDVLVVSATGKTMEFGDWRRSAVDRTASGSKVAVWIDIDSGTAVRIEEQELP